jgi:hypothetical protein
LPGDQHYGCKDDGQHRGRQLRHLTHGYPKTFQSRKLDLDH